MFSVVLFFQFISKMAVVTEVTRPKPSSAPNPSLRSKSTWVTTKNNTQKEIEAWAKDGTRTHELTRSSGQLPENVTEQRLLQAKLWELSKERHKFLSQNTYEKKMFLDQQKRKSDVFQELLKDVIIDVRGRSRNLPKPRSEKYKRKEQRPQSISLPTENDKSSSSIPLFQTEPRGMIRIKTDESSRFPQISESNTSSSVVKFANSCNKSFNAPKKRESVNKWAKKPPTKRESAGPMADPRYVSLTNALSCTYVIPPDSPDIPSLVKRSRALHQRGKNPVDAKPKLAMMVKEFMAERGIVF